MDCILSYSYRFTPESHEIPPTISFNNTCSTFLSSHSVSKPFYLTEKLGFCLHHCRKTLRNIRHKRVAGLWPTNWIRLACLSVTRNAIVLSLFNSRQYSSFVSFTRRKAPMYGAGADFFLRDGASEKTKAMKQVAR